MIVGINYNENLVLVVADTSNATYSSIYSYETTNSAVYLYYSNRPYRNISGAFNTFFYL